MSSNETDKESTKSGQCNAFVGFVCGLITLIYSALILSNEKLDPNNYIGKALCGEGNAVAGKDTRHIYCFEGIAVTGDNVGRVLCSGGITVIGETFPTVLLACTATTTAASMLQILSVLMYYFCYSTSISASKMMKLVFLVVFITCYSILARKSFGVDYYNNYYYILLINAIYCSFDAIYSCYSPSSNQN